MTPGSWSNDYVSWGRTQQPRQWVTPVGQGARPIEDVPADLTMLGRGLGRSYGDSCLNADNALVLTSSLDHFLSWDPAGGVLRAEAGVSLRDVADLVVPRGWFLPVTPGTEFVSLGGAVANDIHGKNHHRRGTFGAWVTALELARSDGSRLRCSRAENADLFRATIGGLGLTGLIVWIELRLVPVAGPWIAAETIRFAGLDEFADINRQSEHGHEYTVAWVDSLDPRGRGRYIRGNHAPRKGDGAPDGKPRAVTVPFTCPRWTLNPPVVKAFNALYYRRPATRGDVHFRGFCYPLDALHDWPKLYGPHGFFQYQCVVPPEAAAAVNALLAAVLRSNQGSCLSVLKTFGPQEPEGLLSFPRPGFTLAVDVANRGAGTRALLDRMDAIVAEAGGALYPAKDARMSPAMFKASFPRCDEFARFVDPRFSSSFWRRVAA